MRRPLTLQAICRYSRADGAGLGHLAPCGWLATGKTSGSNAGFPAVMSTSTWRWRLSLLEGCTVSSGLQPLELCVGNAYQGADVERLPVTLADAAVLFEILRWCARRSARMLSHY